MGKRVYTLRPNETLHCANGARITNKLGRPLPVKAPVGAIVTAKEDK